MSHLMNKSRIKKILALALPITAAMTSQNVLNLVDTAMVGTLGDAALAGVGLGTFMNFVVCSLVMGLGAGVQAIAARRVGEGRAERSAYALNAGLLITAIFTIPVMMLLYFLAPWIFSHLNNDPAVVAEGMPYMRIRFLGMMAFGMNFSFRGFWNGIDRSRIYMRILIFMHATNIILNYLLIFGKFGLPALGSLGAAIGTSTALYIGAIYHWYLAWQQARPNGFLEHLPKRETIQSMLKLSLPAGLQSLFFSAGFTLMYKIIGMVGTKELAAANVLSNIVLLAILPGIGFGLAAASLAGQALGRKNRIEAKQWGWDTTKMAMSFVAVIAALMLLFPKWILSGFLHEPDTLRLARLPLILTGLTITFDIVGLVFLNALHGTGDSKISMLVSIGMQWFLFLPVAWGIAKFTTWGLIGIWSAFVCYRLLHAAVFTKIWSGTWWGRVAV